MLLKNNISVIHGCGDAIGSEAARALARDGARVFLAVAPAPEWGRLKHHTSSVATKTGCLRITLNAACVTHVQETPLAELLFADFETSVAAYTMSNVMIAKAVARHMRGRGAILTLSTPGARMSRRGFLGNCVASAAVETFSRILARELGRSGIRGIFLRPDAILEFLVAVLHARATPEGFASKASMCALPVRSEGRGLQFATAYVPMQLGRTLFMM